MKVHLLILLLHVSACFSTKTAANFSFVSWNADAGQHWRAAKHYFLKSNVDLMAIQAAAQLPHHPSIRELPEGDSVSTEFLSTAAGNPPFEIEQYLWNLTNQDQVYLYYYTDPNSLPNEAPHSRPSSSGTRNLAILSRHKAQRLFLLPTVDAEGEFVEPTDDHQQPTLMGMQVESALFLNFHSRDRNSAAIVDQITNVTAADYPTLTWALMGDFDQTPADLTEALAQLPSPTNDTFRRLVATGAATRVARPWDKRKSHPADSFDEGFACRKHHNRKHRRKSGHRLMNVPRTLLQPNASDELQLPMATPDRSQPFKMADPGKSKPLKMVRRKNLKHLWQAAVRRRSSRKRKAAASRETDYAVFGGPYASRHIMKWVNVELLKNYFSRVKIAKYTRNPSHHLPLIFNKQL